MTTFSLKSQGVNPWPSARSLSRVSAPPWTSVLADSAALRPRFCRVPLAVSCGEPLVSEPLAWWHPRTIKSLRGVVRNVPFVQPKRELIDVAVKMFFAGVMIDAVQPALQDGPDALDAVGMTPTTGVLTRPWLTVSCEKNRPSRSL